MPTYYDILGVSRNATQEEIKRAYREQIKFFHPDVFDGPPEVASIKTKQLNEAYSVLSNPDRRRNYDAYLSAQDRQREAEERESREREEKNRQENEEQEKAKQDAEQACESETNAAEKEYTVKKAKFWKKVVSVAALASIVVVLACYSIYATFNCKDYEQYKDLYNDVVEENKKLESQVSELESICEMYSTEAEALREENEEWKYATTNLIDECAFWHTYAVIVTSTGSKYHTYGCSHLGDNPFWIYNIDLAKSKGYVACLDCDPPT